MSELKTYRKIHIVGIGGAGMSGLATLLSQLGWQVTGSDLKPGPVVDPLSDLGIEWWTGHRPERAGQWDLVVASSAVPDTDPELCAATDAGVPVWQRPALLGAITSMFPTFGFTGTHGKTTSTALAVTAFHSLGLDPTFIVGGQLADLNTGAHLGQRDLFILEADEAFGTFQHLSLAGLTITNIEPDHLDHYGSLQALADAFESVAASVEGPVVACLDDPGAARVAGNVGAVGYGLSVDANWRVTDLVHGNWQVSFKLEGPVGSIPVMVPKPGDHIARNAAGVLALIGELGYDVGRAAAGLSQFAGVRRRFDVRSRVADVTVVDDYAHHPTEVRVTLDAARLGTWNRVWAVFQPHRYSRTADLADQFGAPLASADRTVVTDVYPAGETPIPGVNGRLVADAVAQHGGRVEYAPRLADVVALLSARVEPGDLVLLLGAGDITGVADPLAERLAAVTR